jgi:hypothetical protein
MLLRIWTDNPIHGDAPARRPSNGASAPPNMQDRMRWCLLLHHSTTFVVAGKIVATVPQSDLFGGLVGPWLSFEQLDYKIDGDRIPIVTVRDRAATGTTQLRIAWGGQIIRASHAIGARNRGGPRPERGDDRNPCTHGVAGT